MFPALPSKVSPELEILKAEVLRLSAQLGKGLHPKVIEAIGELMLSVNSYYTNAMEGNPSKLKDIEDALNQKLSPNKSTRNYQLEHLAHISTQKKMLDRLRNEKNLDICSEDFLCWIHKDFYQQLPEEMHFALTHSGEKVPVFPGILRDRPADVGRHHPPKTSEEIKNHLENFKNFLSPQNVEETKKMLAFASSHHRLLWIHPFRDGNGRVARLFTTAYQFKAGIHSHNLWTVTRAFARNRSDYDKYLDLADQPRRNDYDGRGPLSEESLTQFCGYFLKECLDQITYMDSILELHTLEKRYQEYGKMLLAEKLISKSSLKVLEALFYKGLIARGEVQEICHVGRRRATEIIKELLFNSLVHSESAHGDLRIFFTASPLLFPKLE